MWFYSHVIKLKFTCVDNEIEQKIVHFKIYEHKGVFGRGKRKLILKMSQSKDTVKCRKKKKRNEEGQEGKDQVLFFQELKSYFDKNS